MTVLVNFVLVRITSDPLLSPLRTTRPSIQFSSTQVYHDLSRIKCTTTGSDGIPFWVWKEDAAIFTPVLEVLWNKSMAHQSWPKRWKEANINPLAKVDIPTEYPDYRGTNVQRNSSVWCWACSQAFERAIAIYCTFNKNSLENLISDSQFAYRTGSSCLNELSSENTE